MKHRSIGIFIILAASLAAIPQASQELAALRDALGQRARVELWSAFLDLQSGGRRGVQPVAPAAVPAAVASCETARTASGGPASKASAKNDDARTQSKEQPRRAGADETAMIIVDPSQDPLSVKVAFEPAARPATRSALRAVTATGLRDGAEFAMLVAPGEGLEIDADAFARDPQPRPEHHKRAWLRRDEIAELEKHAFADAAREGELVRRGQREAERAHENARRQLRNGTFQKGGVEVKPAENLLRVFKFKPEKIGPAAPVASGARPVRQIYTPAIAPVPAPPAAESE